MSLTSVALVAVLATVGTYLVLHRTLTRIVLGLALLANAVNLLVLTSGGAPGAPPIVGADQGPPTDPVPQALVLTAIVISLGVVAFLLGIAYRSWTIDGNDEVEDDLEDRRLAEGDPGARTAAADGERDGGGRGAS